jgi:phospholipase C
MAIVRIQGQLLDTLQMALPNIVDVNKVGDDGKMLRVIFDRRPNASGKLKLINALTGYEEVIRNGKESVEITMIDGWYDVCLRRRSQQQ